MRNYIQPGNSLTVPSPGDVQGGEIVTMGELVGVAAGDAATGADLDLVLVGVFDLPKVGTDAITIGAPVYLDAGVVTTDDDSGANPLVGHAVTAAPNPSASIHVRLKG
jgi:predicted RecA/RadA family phage recombinase